MRFRFNLKNRPQFSAGLWNELEAGRHPRTDNPIMKYEEWFEWFENELREISREYDGFECRVDIEDLLWRARRAVPLTDWEAGVVAGFVSAIKMILGEEASR